MACLSLIQKILVITLIFIPATAFNTPEVIETDRDSKNPKIIIGGDYNYPPYEYLDEQGNPKGYNVELTKAIMEALGMNYEIRLGPWNDIRESMENGEIDVVHGMFYSRERDTVFDFSPPHTYIFHSIFGREGEQKVQTLEDIEGKEIIVMEGDIMHDFVLENRLTSHLVLVKDQAEALRLLASGQHDYALIAKLPGLYWINELGLSNLIALGKPIEGFQYCYATKEGDRELLSKISEELAILNQTGEYGEIYSNWLGLLEPTEMQWNQIIKYIIAGIALLLLVFLVAAVWVWTLKKQVLQRTKELSETKSLLKVAMDQSQAGIAIADAPDGKLRYVNDAGLGIRGKEKQELVNGIGIEQYVESWQILHLDGTPYKNDEVPLARAVLYGETLSTEFIVRRTDNEDRIVLANAAPILDDKGDVSAGIVIFLDVTERKKIEDKLQISEQRYKSLVQNIQTAVVVHKADTKIVICNKMAQDILGLTESQLLGKEAIDPYWKFIDENGEVLPVEDYPVNRVIASGKSLIDYVIGVQRPDKAEPVWVLVNAIPNFDVKKNLSEITIAFLDITDRIKAEQQIRSSLKEKETLLHEIHHRVKNNMQIIASLLKMQLNKKDKQDIDAILKENMGRIYSMAAIHESLHQSEKLSEIDFKSYLQKLAQMLSQTYSVEPGKVAFQIDCPELKLAIDIANPLGLVLNELISNSLKYAYPNGQKGTISIKTSFLDKKAIELMVADDGTGFPDGFDWENSDSLGLKLVQNLVGNQLDGSIELDNANGTRFTIRFNLESNYTS